jgi:6-phosphogluconolactonase
VIRRFPTAKAAAEACGEATLELLADARRLRGSARLAVSGGSTPKVMFESMSGRSFDWTDIDVFQVDERCVPPDHEQSNYRMIRRALNGPRTIHRMLGELPPAEGASLYEDEVGEAEFDVIQRGMGADGHTASIFPGLPLPESKRGIAGWIWVPAMSQNRITLMPSVLERARTTLCLVTGSDKAEALYAVLRGPRDTSKFPAQISSPAMIWFIDDAAAAKLES